MISPLNRVARWRIAALGLAAAGLLTAGTAASATNSARPFVGWYGGGNLSHVNKTGSGDALLLIRVLGNRRRVLFEHVVLSERCHGPGLNPSVTGFEGSPAPVPASLSRDGSFHGKAVYFTTSSVGKFRNELTFSGHFTTSSEAVVTSRIQSRGVTNPAYRCDTGSVNLRVADSDVSAAGGKSRVDTTYYGTNLAGTSTQGDKAPGPLPRVQDWPMMVRTAKHGSVVARIFYFYTTKKCKSGKYVSTGEFGPRPAAVSKGSFTEHDDRQFPLAGGFTTHIHTAVSGRFTASRVHGTLQVNIAVTNSSGSVIDHCSTGIVPWDAVR